MTYCPKINNYVKYSMWFAGSDLTNEQGKQSLRAPGNKEEPTNGKKPILII